MASRFEKDPNAILDFSEDWGAWLAPIADTIETSTWIIPAGITNAGESNTATIATIWLSGGTLATTYTLVNRIHTVGGRTEDHTIYITIKEH